MKLFTCGPVQMYPSTAQIRANGFIHFRTTEYGDMVKSVLSRLNKMLGNSEPNSIIYLASSGTGAMEGVVENCICPKDKALVINGGAFGKRFCELLKYHGIPFDSIDLKWNETFTKEHFIPYENGGYTHLFVNHHETHTGQLYDISLISDFCKRNNLYLVVDAISSFLADEYNMEKYGIDVSIISSQKGLCCSPGMSLVSLSKRMIKKVMDSPETKSRYFDFKDYLINIPRGQTPYTPPVCVMYEINDMLNLIDNEGGVSGRIKNIQKKAAYFREKIKEIGLNVPDYPVSNMLTPVVCKDINALDIINALKNDYQIYVNPCGGDLKDTLLRVSHIGNTSFEDIDYLINVLSSVIKEKENN